MGVHKLCTSSHHPNGNEGVARVNHTMAECSLLSVCSQVAVRQVVADQTLMSRDSGALENRQRETWKSTNVKLVGAKPVAALTELLYANST